MDPIRVYMVDISSTPVLRCDDISKVYPSGLKALDRNTFDVGSNEFLGLVGPSGCGKSTLLRIIAGLTESTTGTVIRNQPRVSQGLRVGFVFQDPTLMPWATVGENIALPLHLDNHSGKDVERRVEEVLDWVRLSSFKDSYPRELSGGMRMRVSIARALSTKPHLLLLDEPFAALDEFTRAQLNEELLGLWETQEWTCLFVTHSIREATFLSDRIMIMSARPGSIIGNVSIPFARPRQENLRNTHQFSDLCALISGKLAANTEGT